MAFAFEALEGKLNIKAVFELSEYSDINFLKFWSSYASKIGYQSAFTIRYPIPSLSAAYSTTRGRARRL